MEDLREKCLYNWAYSHPSSRGMYWAYMIVVHKVCYKTINGDCSIAAMQALGIPISLIYYGCPQESYTNWNDINSIDTKNTILEGELNYWKQYGTGIYPSIVINNKTYRGNIEPLSVYNAICAGFANPPEICKQTLGIMTPVTM